MSWIQAIWDKDILSEAANLEQVVSVFEVLATIAAAVIAGWALGYARAQVDIARTTQQETTAHNWFHDYEVRCFENPKLANPELAQFDYESGRLDGSAELFEKYEWFVSLMLNAGEAITDLRPTLDWQNSVKSQIKFHHRYLRSDRVRKAGYLERNYSEPFQALAREALEEVEMDGQRSQLAEPTEK